MDISATLKNWMQPPHNRWAFHNVSELIPTALLSNTSGIVNILPRRPVDLADVSFIAADGSMTQWERHLAESYCDAICVIHRGHIVAEQYFNGLHQESRHLLMSVTKSVTAAALGVAIGRGLLATDDYVCEVAPEFAGGSLDGCTIRHLIDMTAGTDFVEDYDLYLDAEADVPLLEYERQAGFRPLGKHRAIGVLEHFATYSNARPHGQIFDYRSPLTNIVARVLEIVNGLPFPEILSRDIWSPLGMEHEANIALDPRGFPIAEAGISCTVRDLARFGLAYLNEGVVQEQTVFPREWILDTRRGDDEAEVAFSKYRASVANAEGSDWSMYHNAFWVKERDQEFSGLGIFGQYIWIHRPTSTVISRFSTYPRALPESLSEETLRGFTAVARALQERF